MDSGAEEPPRDVNRGPEILAICGTLVGLALALVILRVWVRVKMVKHLGADDYTIIVAMVRQLLPVFSSRIACSRDIGDLEDKYSLISLQTVMFAEMMVIIPQVQLGAGRHYQYIKPESNIVKGLHLNFVTQPLCLIGLCLTKVSVGLFLLRITPSKKFKWFLWGCIIFTILSATGNFRKWCSVQSKGEQSFLEVEIANTTAQ